MELFVRQNFYSYFPLNSTCKNLSLLLPRATMRRKPVWDWNNTEMDRVERQTPFPKMLFKHLVNQTGENFSLFFILRSLKTKQNKILSNSPNSYVFVIMILLEIILSTFENNWYTRKLHKNIEQSESTRLTAIW